MVRLVNVSLHLITGLDVMSKLYDNGLTDEQQKLVDARYEELMAKVKEINPKAYKLLRETKPLDEKIFGLEEEQEQLVVSSCETISIQTKLQLLSTDFSSDVYFFCLLLHPFLPGLFLTNKVALT